MDRVETLGLAREQLILSLLVRGVCSVGAGVLETSLAAISLGPWSIGREEIDKLDRSRAAWGLEKIATQNLAIALDTALERKVPNRLKNTNDEHYDYFCFVRCLRNAFTHDPYQPRWVLNDHSYQRCYALHNAWRVDLTSRDGTDVEPRDYKHAGGLVQLCDLGVKIIRAAS